MPSLNDTLRVNHGGQPLDLTISQLFAMLADFDLTVANLTVTGTIMTDLPTVDPANEGQLWNSTLTVKVSEDAP